MERNGHVELSRRRLLAAGGSGATLAAAGVIALPEAGPAATPGEPFWMLNAREFGAKGDDATDDTAAINAALRELSRKEFSALYFPPGNYIVSGPLDPLTRSSTAVYGAGPDTSRFTVNPSAGGMGTLFKVGSDSAPLTARINLANFGINFQNDVDVDQNPFVVRNAADVRIENIWLNDPAGLVTLGSNANQCSRVRVQGIRGDYRAELDGNKVLNLVRAINAHFRDIHMITGTASGAGYSVHIAPPATGFIDTVRIESCAIWAENQPHGVYLDFTNQKIVNVWIEESIFDQTSAAAFTIRSASGARDFRSLWVSDCRATTNSGKAVEIAHAGSGPLGPVNFVNNLFDYANDYAVVASGANARGLSFIGNDFRAVSQSQKATAAMRFNCSHWEAVANKFRPYAGLVGSPVPTNPAYAVETGDNVDDFLCVGNVASGITADFFKHFAYPAESLRRIESHNVGAKSVGGIDLTPTLEFGSVAKDPGAPPAGKARLFVRTVSGTAELCVRFPTGQVKVLASQ
jgi:hypothetical protein